jgi:hypothetical protein
MGRWDREGEMEEDQVEGNEVDLGRKLVHVGKKVKRKAVQMGKKAVRKAVQMGRKVVRKAD